MTVETQAHTTSSLSIPRNGESLPGETVLGEEGDPGKLSSATEHRPGPLDDLLAADANVNSDDRIQAEMHCLILADVTFRSETALTAACLH